ncbi:MAG: flagellar basal body rod protein FlgC [Pseudomonadota bacterium]
MHDLMKAMTSSASGLRAQSARLRLIGENVANADTPGFQRKRVVFERMLDGKSGAEMVRPTRINLDQSPARESYEPGHPMADERGIVTYSNVDTLIEMADAREAQRSYQANLTLFDQARRMYGSMLDLLRR